MKTILGKLIVFTDKSGNLGEMSGTNYNKLLSKNMDMDNYNIIEENWQLVSLFKNYDIHSLGRNKKNKEIETT